MNSPPTDPRLLIREICYGRLWNSGSRAEYPCKLFALDTEYYSATHDAGILPPRDVPRELAIIDGHMRVVAAYRVRPPGGWTPSIWSTKSPKAGRYFEKPFKGLKYIDFDTARAIVVYYLNYANAIFFWEAKADLGKFGLLEYYGKPPVVDLVSDVAIKLALGQDTLASAVKLRVAFYHLFGGVGQNLPEVAYRTVAGRYTKTYMPDGEYLVGTFPITRHFAVTDAVMTMALGLVTHRDRVDIVATSRLPDQRTRTLRPPTIVRYPHDPPVQTPLVPGGSIVIAAHINARMALALAELLRALGEEVYYVAHEETILRVWLRDGRRCKAVRRAILDQLADSTSAIHALFRYSPVYVFTENGMVSDTWSAYREAYLLLATVPRSPCVADKTRRIQPPSLSGSTAMVPVVGISLLNGPIGGPCTCPITPSPPSPYTMVKRAVGLGQVVAIKIRRVARLMAQPEEGDIEEGGVQRVWGWAEGGKGYAEPEGVRLVLTGLERYWGKPPLAPPPRYYSSALKVHKRADLARPCPGSSIADIFAMWYEQAGVVEIGGEEDEVPSPLDVVDQPDIKALVDNWLDILYRDCVV